MNTNPTLYNRVQQQPHHNKQKRSSTIGSRSTGTTREHTTKNMHDVTTVTTTGDGGQRSRTMMMLLTLLLIGLLVAAPIAADADIDPAMPPTMRSSLIGSAGSATARRAATEPLGSWESRSQRARRNAEAPRDLCSMPGCRCSGFKLEVVQCNFTGSVSWLLWLEFTGCG